MIEELGIVRRVEGDDAWVDTQRKSSCGSCSAKGCGTGALAKVIGNRPQQLKLVNSIGAKAGDTVVLGINESALVKGSLAAYIAPLLFMFIGGLLGQTMAEQLGLSVDASSAVLGVIGLAIGLLWLKLFGRKTATSEQYQPVMVRLANPTVGNVIRPLK